MPTPTKGPRLGAGPSHERLMLSNLAASLFDHGRIKTTEAKAKRLRPYAEKLITLGKRGDLHARRQVFAKIQDKDIVYRLFSAIAPQYANRHGGYTRITKIGPRKGDNAPMVVIELVEGEDQPETEAAEAPAAGAATGTGQTAPEEEPTAPAAAEESATEAGDRPAEDTASAQTEEAAQGEQAEGEKKD